MAMRSLTGLLVGVTVFAVGAALPVIALGQVQCSDTAKAMEDLAAAQLKPAWIGLDDRGMLTSVFVAENGSWIIIITGPDGVTCRIGGGADAESFVPVFGVES